MLCQECMALLCLHHSTPTNDPVLATLSVDNGELNAQRLRSPSISTASPLVLEDLARVDVNVRETQLAQILHHLPQVRHGCDDELLRSFVSVHVMSTCAPGH